MSTLRLTNLQHASAASPAIVLAADGSATAQVSSLNGGPLSGTRNRIINGDMRIDARNAGASVTPAGTIYTIDRWQLGITQASRISISRQATSGFGFTNYALLTIASTATVGSTDFFQLTQSIEGLNVSDLEWGTANAKSVTLSFWGYSSVSGTYGGVLKNGGGTRSYPFTYTLPAASWTYISITVPGDTTGTWATDNTTGIQLGFSLGMGSTYSGPAGAWASANYGSATGATSLMGTSGATFALTGVQLEPGTVATPFERIDYSESLRRCQRYFEPISKYERYSGASSIATGFTQISIPFKISKRSTSYSTYWSTATVFSTRTNTVTFFSPSPGGDSTQAPTISATYLESITITGSPTNGTTGGLFFGWIENEL